MEHELNRYVELTTWIRELSSPQIINFDSSEEYRINLIRSFMRIGELAKMNQIILDEFYYPLLQPGVDLSDKDIDLLRDFSELLLDATSMENIDLPMLYIQSEKLLEDAEKKEDDRLILLALDNMVMASYAMLTVTLRLYPCYDICFKYRDNGINAANRIIEYLDKEKFKKLDDYCKEIVLINSRYISAMFEWGDNIDFDKQTHQDMEMMERSLALADDPFYLNEAPNYNWDYHKFRTLQYITCFTEYRNQKRFDDELLKKILGYTEQFIDFLNNNIPEMIEECTPSTQDLYLLRNKFLAKAISLEDYKQGLRDLFARREMTNYSSFVLYTNFTVPYEYILVLDRDNLTKEDTELLRDFYNEMIGYIYHMPKIGVLSFMLSFLSYILRNYIEVEGAPSLEEMCLSLMAALHPPTFVHTMSVADFSTALTKHLLNRSPELFIGILDIQTKEEVIERKKEILEFVRHSALCHDIGKLFIIETIITYGRKLLPSEFDLIKAHPEAGACLLDKYESTKAYAEMATGHHKWFDNSTGYPMEFDMDNAKNKVIISLLTVADCLDASTDSVGRNYKEGKTLDEYITEIEHDSGTRYAPYVVSMLRDKEVYDELKELLEKDRDENYRKTYDLLKEL